MVDVDVDVAVVLRHLLVVLPDLAVLAALRW